MEDDEPVAGDVRSSFLNGNKSYLLYMWQLFDDADILERSESMLKGKDGGDSTHVPTTMASESTPTPFKRQRMENQKLSLAQAERIGSAIEEIRDQGVAHVMASNSSSMAQLSKDLLTFTRQRRDATIEEEIVILDNAIARTKADMASYEAII